MAKSDLDLGYIPMKDSQAPLPPDAQAGLAAIVDQLRGLSQLITKVRREVNFRTFSILVGGSQLPARIQQVRCYVDVIHNPSSIAVSFSFNDGAIPNKINATLAAGAFLQFPPWGIEFSQALDVATITANATLLVCGRVRW